MTTSTSTISPITHDTFTVERRLRASAERVFATMTQPELKARWFVGPPGWQQVERTLDFRVGGKERVVGRFDSGKTSEFDATYLDIVPNQRVVYSYVMGVSGRKMSVSLATLQMIPDGDHTRLALTEQGVFFDDPADAAGRAHGTNFLMDQIAALFA